LNFAINLLTILQAPVLELKRKFEDSALSHWPGLYQGRLASFVETFSGMCVTHAHRENLITISILLIKSFSDLKKK
jgi:hypothetical protein